MERMDRVRRWGGLIWVGVVFVAMRAWLAPPPASPPGLVTWIVVVTVAAGTLAMLVAPRDSLRWWGGRVAGIAIGLELVGAVADRFGLLGGPGSPGVSWGDWSHFRAESAELVPWNALAQPAAIAATIAELESPQRVTVSGYFKPAPVFSTTTSSPARIQPDWRSRPTAAKQAAPSGQTNA